MPLSIRPLTLEDMPTYVSLNNLAFEATISRMLFESPLSAASSEVLHVKVLEALRDDKSSHFFMAVDDDAAEPVGCAHWLVHEEWRPPAKEGDEAAALEASAERLATLPEARNGGKVTRGFFRERLGRGKVLPEGKPRIELNNIFVHPDHQGRGAGRLLMRWGIDVADEKGLEILLNATPAGKPVYERYGFKSVEEFEFDATKYGGEGVWTTSFMLRLPNSGNTANVKPGEDAKIEAAGVIS